LSSGSTLVDGDLRPLAEIVDKPLLPSTPTQAIPFGVARRRIDPMPFGGASSDLPASSLMSRRIDGGVQLLSAGPPGDDGGRGRRDGGRRD